MVNFLFRKGSEKNHTDNRGGSGSHMTINGRGVEKKSLLMAGGLRKSIVGFSPGRTFKNHNDRAFLPVPTFQDLLRNFFV